MTTAATTTTTATTASATTEADTGDAKQRGDYIIVFCLIFF